MKIDFKEDYNFRHAYFHMGPVRADSQSQTQNMIAAVVGVMGVIADASQTHYAINTTIQKVDKGDYSVNITVTIYPPIDDRERQWAKIVNELYPRLIAAADCGDIPNEAIDRCEIIFYGPAATKD